MSATDLNYAEAKCEKCGSVFQILVDRIKPEGSTVRCGKCGHSFLFTLPEHLRGAVNPSKSKLPHSAWGNSDGEPKKKKKGDDPEEATIVGTRLLNQSPRAKKIRRFLNLTVLFVGIILGLSTQLKRLTFTDLIFAVKYGISPTYQGLQVVKISGEHFSSTPSLHILKVTGEVYNHQTSTYNSPALALTVLSPTGEFIRKFPVTCCQPGNIPPHATGQFQAKVEIEHTGDIGSYFVGEEAHVPATPATN